VSSRQLLPVIFARKISSFARSSPTDLQFRLEIVKANTDPKPILLRRAEDTEEGLVAKYLPQHLAPC
jgi:hypothetical protein